MVLRGCLPSDGHFAVALVMALDAAAFECIKGVLLLRAHPGVTIGTSDCVQFGARPVFHSDAALPLKQFPYIAMASAAIDRSGQFPVMAARAILEKGLSVILPGRM